MKKKDNNKNNVSYLKDVKLQRSKKIKSGGDRKSSAFKESKPSKPPKVKKPKKSDLLPGQELLPGQGLSSPVIPGLREEKSVISQGIMALNKALFEQSIHESGRLGKIRGILSTIEDDLLDPEGLKGMDAVTKLRLFEVLRRDSQGIVNFLEKMQRNSLSIMLTFDIYKQLMDMLEKEEVDPVTGIMEGVDKSKVLEVKGALLNMISGSRK